MKLKLLFISLFIIATTFAAAHEVKHLSEHDGSSCQICLVDKNNISGDIIAFNTTQEMVTLSDKIGFITSFRFQRLHNTNQNRAPPLFS